MQALGLQDADLLDIGGFAAGQALEVDVAGMVGADAELAAQPRGEGSLTDIAQDAGPGAALSAARLYRLQLLDFARLPAAQAFETNLATEIHRHAAPPFFLMLTLYENSEDRSRFFRSPRHARDMCTRATTHSRCLATRAMPEEYSRRSAVATR